MITPGHFGRQVDSCKLILCGTGPLTTYISSLLCRRKEEILAPCVISRTAMTSGCEAAGPSCLQQPIRSSLPTFFHGARRRWKRALMPQSAL
jgi:hypothetical protein